MDTYRWRWWALAALLVAEAMNLLDTTTVQVAGPTIRADLGGSGSEIQWISAAYTLPFAVLLITGGRLGDIAGRKRVFRIGVAGFMVASLACALAPSIGPLIAFRAIQGAAAAAIIPQTIGLIKTMFVGPEVSRALGSIGPVMGLAAVGGPVLGGVLTHADLFGSSWRAVFLVNVPLSIMVVVVARLLVEDRSPRRPGLDAVGTALAAIGTGLLVYPLVEAGTTSMSVWGWASVGMGLAVLVAFGMHERGTAARGRSPLVEVSLFDGRVFPAALATSTVFFAVTSGLTLVVVLHMQLGLGTDARTVGLTLLPCSVGMGLMSWLSGAYLVSRFGSALRFAGFAVLLAGVAAAATAATPLPIALAAIGSGVGLFTPSFFIAALHVVAPHEVGSAAGLLNAVQQLGATLGVAILGSIYLATRSLPPTLWAAGALLVACVATSTLMNDRLRTRPDHRDRPEAAVAG